MAFQEIPFTYQATNLQCFNTLKYYITTNKINDFVEQLNNFIDQHNFDINFKAYLTPSKTGSLLIYASSINRIHFVRVLHQNNADINSLDNYNNNSLHYAIFNQYPRLIEYLQKNNIDFYQKNSQQKIPIQLSLFFRL